MAQLDYGNRGQQPAKNRLLVVMLCVVILCMVSFALGIMVGKSGSETVVTSPSPPALPQTAPIPPQPQAVKVESPVAPTASAAAVATVQDDTSSAVVPEADPLKELLPAPEQMPLGSGINQPTRQPVTLPSAEKAAAVVAVVDQAVKSSGAVESPGSVKPVEAAPSIVVPPVADVAPAAVPTAKQEVPAGPHYVVQVASFKKNSDAVALQKKLLAHFPVYVQKVDLESKGVWYRVLVGPAASSAEAKELLARLKQKTKLNGFIKKISHQ